MQYIHIIPLIFRLFSEIFHHSHTKVISHRLTNAHIRFCGGWPPDEKWLPLFRYMSSYAFASAIPLRIPVYSFLPPDAATLPSLVSKSPPILSQEALSALCPAHIIHRIHRDSHLIKSSMQQSRVSIPVPFFQPAFQ